jgi:hypothetical protein
MKPTFENHKQQASNDKQIRNVKRGEILNKNGKERHALSPKRQRGRTARRCKEMARRLAQREPRPTCAAATRFYDCRASRAHRRTGNANFSSPRGSASLALRAQKTRISRLKFASSVLGICLFFDACGL